MKFRFFSIVRSAENAEVKAKQVAAALTNHETVSCAFTIKAVGM